MHFLTTTLFTILLTLLSVYSAPHQFLRRSLGPPKIATVPLKHVTRAQLVNRASHPKERVRRMHGEVVIRPYPKSTCKGFTSTGLVPYARWTNLDQHGVGNTGVLTVRVENRDICVQMCESNLECVSATYDLATMNCYQITDTGASSSELYFHGDADVTTKGTSCDDLSAISAKHPDAFCCTEYRPAVSLQFI